MTEVEVHLINGHTERPFYGNSESSKGVCNCCPYGYHIDLDFVRFCEKLAKASGEPSLSKKMRRERRRQRQSIEVLLGLTSPVIWNIEQLLPPIVQESSPTTENPVSSATNYSSHTLSNEGLNKAVLDFEATLERTSKKKHKNDELDAFVNPSVELNNQTIKREKSPVYEVPQTTTSFTELDTMYGYHISGGTNQSSLQNIREQMAISLKRMRELEEKVKLISTLEFELHSLKNEKYELLEKLDKSKSMLRHAQNHINEINQEKRKEASKISKIELKPILRDVGISCRVLTRDVGIASVAQKSRTIGTETTAEIQVPEKKIEVPKSDVQKLKSTKSQTQLHTADSSTITDLYMKDIFNMLEKKEKKLSQKQLDGISVFPRSLDLLSKGIQTVAKESSPVLQVCEKREAGVQVSNEKKQVRDAGFTAKPKMYDVSSDIRPRTREYGSSDDRITDVLCDKCKNVKTRSVGIGFGNVNSVEPCALNRSRSFQLTEAKPKIMTRTVGVGTLVPVKKLTSSKGVGTHDFRTNTIKSTGVNTVKVDLVETGSVTDKMVDAGTGRKICEKCGEDAKSPQKPVKSSREIGGSSKEFHPSRIPRPKSNQNTPVMERKKFVRQDTYTKLPSQSPFDISNKPTTRVKSTVEKLSSPSDEKVEVILRQKNKTSLSASPSSTDKLSKDLKDLNLSTSSDRYSAHFDDYYFDYDENYDDSSKRNSALYSDNVLFQPINNEPREKIKPSKEMKAAMKVVNDSLSKYPDGLPKQLKNASNIIQQEWFKISSTASANPLDVEDYLDSFEEVSSTLLEFIVNMVDNNGNTAMHYTVSHGNFDVVSILLDSKVCNINKMNAAGYTCVMLVSLAQVRSETHRQVVKRLFQLADVNIRAKQHGQTALMLAVSHGRLDMVKLLLEAGADPNIQDGDGSTALMCAAEHGHLEIVKHILAHPECDTSIVDCDGSTALAIAMEAGNRDIGVLLYAREHFSASRGSSPYTSLRQKKSRSSTSPYPRTPPSPNPNRKSDHSV